MPKWWLISDEDIQTVKEALGLYGHGANDLNCEDRPSGSGRAFCEGCRAEEKRKAAIHILDTGLNVTDAVPSDFVQEVADA